jgi:NADH-quinone oxidoreductase subunit H
MFYFFFKTFLMYFVVAWIRISMPRLRIDQMLNFNWKFLTPIALVLLIATALVEKTLGLTLPGSGLVEAAIPWVRATAHLAVNLLLLWGVISLLKKFPAKTRKVVGSPRPVAVAPEPPASVIS